MKVYGYYSKTDSTREIRGKVSASSLSEAIELMSNKKMLTIEQFTDIYSIIQIN